ncbi:hypothetical protein [Mucilaginibacter sp.]|uniref:hypothetical protein n=1 Tax=Mucilaginibacter sp. TaxID=1882438 RepID=UPI003267F154
MLSSNDKIDKGTLKLQSSSRPPLPAGVYTVNAQVMVDTKGSSIPTQMPQAELSFTITAPRFSLDLALIHSTFPLAGSKGAYENAMPHIILTRKTLPWERVITRNTDEKRPWLYVLLLNEDELPKDAVKEIKLKDVLTGASGLIVPAYPRLDEKEQKIEEKIKVLEIPGTLFKSIAPRSKELDFLAHTRQVDTTDRFNKDKELKKDNDAGWLSVLAANRLPTAGKTNTAFLVSLEGHGDVIDDKVDVTNRNIRLVVMKQWSFKVEGASFASLLQKLNENAQPMQMEFKQLIGKPISQAALKAINYGYTIINHDKRDGKKAVSWYRSPLVPIQKPVPYLHSYQSADKAMRLDVETGVFDISYAAAWQLGRLLALENPGFSGAISDWKNTSKSQKPIMIALDLLTKPQMVGQTKVDAILKPEQLDPVIKEIESDEVLTDFVLDLWKKSKK